MELKSVFEKAKKINSMRYDVLSKQAGCTLQICIPAADGADIWWGSALRSSSTRSRVAAASQLFCLLKMERLCLGKPTRPNKSWIISAGLYLHCEPEPRWDRRAAAPAAESSQISSDGILL